MLKASVGAVGDNGRSLEGTEMMRKLIALCALFLAFGACDSLGPDEITGTYDLETVNGSELPFGLIGIQITGGSITLRSDRSYTARTIIRTTEDDEAVTDVVVEEGTWERSGNTIRLRSDAGVRTDAQLAGRTLTIDDGEIVSVYRR